MPGPCGVGLGLNGKAAEAEDLVQDTLIREFRAVDRFDGAYPRAWLLTILRRTHLNRVRGRKPVLLRDGESVELTLERVGKPAPSADEVVVSDQFEAVVAEALAARPDTHRQVVTRVDIDGLTYQEGDDRLVVPRGPILTQFHPAGSRTRTRSTAAGLAPQRSMLW